MCPFWLSVSIQQVFIRHMTQDCILYCMLLLLSIVHSEQQTEAHLNYFVYIPLP